MNSTKDVGQIDVKRMIEIVLDRIVIILVITLIFGLVFFAVSNYFITPKYESSITLYVNNRSETANDDLESKTLSSDITASQQLVPTYIEMLKSNNVLGTVADKVEAKTGEAFTESEIRKMITAEAVANTEIIKVTVKTTKAAVAKEIAQTISEVVPEKIPNFIERSTVNIIDGARINTKPVEPNVRNSIILGALLGLVLSIAVILLKEIFDVRVKSTDDLVTRFNLPVLGAIPEIYVSYEEASSDEEVLA